MDLRKSTFPHLVVIAPDGSLVTHVVLRTSEDQPSVETLGAWFYSCTAVRVCGVSACAGCTSSGDPLIVRKATDATGAVDFAFSLGSGTCTSQSRVAFEDEFSSYSVPVAFLDQDGDLAVSETDVAVVHSRLGTADFRSDFDGDLVVTAADEDYVRSFVGVHCDAGVPVRPSTWGGLKGRYR
jgi:hypothetical protein